MRVDLRVKHDIGARKAAIELLARAPRLRSSSEATAGLAIANPLKKDLRWKAIREYREERGHAA